VVSRMGAPWRAGPGIGAGPLRWSLSQRCVIVALQPVNSLSGMSG
jgi:hypothetical protein